LKICSIYSPKYNITYMTILNTGLRSPLSSYNFGLVLSHSNPSQVKVFNLLMILACLQAHYSVA